MPSESLPLVATPENCAGKTFIVTGSNTGLGFQTVKHLVAAGAEKIIMGVRNVAAGEKAKAELLASKPATSNTTIDVWQIDLSKFDSIKAFANRVKTDLDRVDNIIANAGLAISKGNVAEGHSLVVTVNVIGTWLFVLLLLPKLNEVAQKYSSKGVVPTMTVVSSKWGYENRAEWDAIKDDPLARMDAAANDPNEPFYTYRLSKLLEMFLIRRLAPLIPTERTGTVLNFLCPGLCESDLDRDSSQAVKDFMAGYREQYGLSADEGSRNQIFAALAGLESHGGYIDLCQIANENLPEWIPDSEAQGYGDRVWSQVMKEIEPVAPGALAAVVAAA